MSHLHAVVQAVVSNQSPPRNAAYPGGPSSQQSMTHHAGGSRGYGSTGSSYANHVYSNYGQQQPYQYGGPSASRQSLGVNRGDSSGSASTRASSNQSSPDQFAGGRGKEPDIPEHDDFQQDMDYTFDEEEDELVDEAEYPRLLDVSWRYMSRLYLLVPLITLLWLVALILVITFAWLALDRYLSRASGGSTHMDRAQLTIRPPDEHERKSGQTYPHQIFWKPMAIGFFASCTIQVARVPVWELVSLLPLSQAFTTLASTASHTVLHELVRLMSVTLIVPSPLSGFHSSYYLGLGWGTAEAAWGIVQGWEQLLLYQDVMRDDTRADDTETGTPVRRLLFAPDGRIGSTTRLIEDVLPEEDEGEHVEQARQDWDGRAATEAARVILTQDEDERAQEAEAQAEEEELERKVEILERMRGRRDLEEVLGIPFPNIPFPLHLLWRLDTLLLNLGLTLLLSAFYFDPYPIYRHLPGPGGDAGDTVNVLSSSPAKNEPSAYLWAVWAAVALLHLGVSLVWRVVGRVGVGAVTWGGLIVALGSVFAGLGAWGGLV